MKNRFTLIKKLPKDVDNAMCMSCQICNDFRICGAVRGKKKFIYFVCAKCKQVVRLRTI